MIVVHKYFVSYAYSEGFGNAVVSIKDKVTGYSNIAKLAETIRDGGDLKDYDLVVLYFKELFNE